MLAGIAPTSSCQAAQSGSANGCDATFEVLLDLAAPAEQGMELGGGIQRTSLP